MKSLLMKIPMKVILMKRIKISLKSIKENSGAVSVETGEFNKVLPYNLRKIEDIATKLFETRLTSTEGSKPQNEGEEHA